MISAISTNSRPRTFFATFVGRRAAWFYSPFECSWPRRAGAGTAERAPQPAGATDANGASRPDPARAGTPVARVKVGRVSGSGTGAAVAACAATEPGMQAGIVEVPVTATVVIVVPRGAAVAEVEAGPADGQGSATGRDVPRGSHGTGTM